MAVLDQELSKLHQTSPLIELYELDCTNLGGALYRFTPHFADAGTVTYRGLTYVSLPIQTEGWEVSSSGTQPRPTLSVSNVNKVLLNAVITLGDIVGATLTRLRTYEKFLDGKPGADQTKYLGPDRFQVEQKVGHDNQMISWQLSSVLERFGTKLPRRQILKDPSGKNLYCPGVSRYRGA